MRNLLKFVRNAQRSSIAGEVTLLTPTKFLALQRRPPYIGMLLRGRSAYASLDMDLLMANVLTVPKASTSLQPPMKNASDAQKTQRHSLQEHPPTCHAFQKQCWRLKMVNPN